MERKGNEEDASGFVKAKGPPPVVHGQSALEMPGYKHVLLRPKLLGGPVGKKQRKSLQNKPLTIKKSNEKYSIILMGGGNVNCKELSVCSCTMKIL